MKFDPPFPSLSQLKKDYIDSDLAYQRGKQLLDMEMCLLTGRDDHLYCFVIEDRFEDYAVEISLKNNTLSHSCNCASMLDCCHHAAGALLALHAELQQPVEPLEEGGEPYTREEMIERVLQERQERAEREEFRITFADNVYGIHLLKTAANRLYEITFRDFKKNSGYCSCPDFKTNKLGTCKHLIAAFRKIQQALPVQKLSQTQPYPFVEIYCDPLKDYHITYFYKGHISVQIASLLEKYFQGGQYIYPEKYPGFLNFLKESGEIKKILIRPEAIDKIDRYFEKQLIARLAETTEPDFGKIKADLYEYQKKGIHFSLFKTGNIIADEMGLGKTLQAIATAVLKKDIYGLKRTLVICPASLKFQWQQEIERFSHEAGVIVEGSRNSRHETYRTADAYFLITNYEAVVRDLPVITRYAPDMIILDEAQRIKNYTTKTSHAVKAIPKKHSLVITGTPIENRLGDLYSIMNFIDPRILAPLWEFSMTHCYFDKTKKDKITGYYNLQVLKTRLIPWLIRREKSEVLDQLPEVQEITVPVNLHPEQRELHTEFSRALAQILYKKHKTVYDMQRMQRLLQSMRMVCDSTFLIDKERNISPKLAELEEILLEKLNIPETPKKVIIFSEWKGMLRLIDKMLKSNDIGSVMFSGDVPVKQREKLIKEFAENPACPVFLSTEAGGSGLNLQMADTVINFELPWNPAKKHQRLGRVHRIGQESPKITAINLVSRQSIEQRILEGIDLKESLFDAVLSEGDLTDEVDFSRKGRATFIEQMQQLIQPFEEPEEDPELTEAIQESPRGKLRFAGQLVLFEEEGVIAAEDDFREDEMLTAEISSSQGPQHPARPSLESQQLEETLNRGLQFLNGLFKMASGKELISEDQAISIDRKSGEVIMKFKLPGF